MVITYSQTDIENLSFKWIIVLCPCVKMANDIGLIQILFQWHVDIQDKLVCLEYSI